MNAKRPHIVILGAGISGLTLGWALKQKFGQQIQLTILEKENRAGGFMHTHLQDGFLFEYGPRSCRPSGTGLETLKLIESLCLEDEVITENPAAKKRYLWKDKKLHLFPSRFFSFLTSPLTKNAVWPILKEFFKPKATLSDESIFSFFKRRFSTEIAESLIDPLVSGIYAGDIQKLSIRACFPFLQEWEHQYGSIGKGLLFASRKKQAFTSFQKQMQKTSLFSFRHGIETLPKALSKHLASEIHLKHPVSALKFSPQAIRIEVCNKPTIRADYVFSTLPSHALAKLIDHPLLSEKLISIPHVPIAVVNLGWHQSVLNHEGFGFLIPSKEKEKILGIVWDSSAFASQNANSNQTRLTVMIGGSHFCPQLFHSLSTAQFTSVATEAVKKHLNIALPPDTHAVKIIPQAIPQYLVGHQEKVKIIQNLVSHLHPSFQILGSSFFGVSVNDCIKKSIQTANDFYLFIRT